MAALDNAYRKERPKELVGELEKLDLLKAEMGEALFRQQETRRAYSLARGGQVAEQKCAAAAKDVDAIGQKVRQQQMLLLNQWGVSLS